MQNAWSLESRPSGDGVGVGEVEEDSDVGNYFMQ